MNYIGTDPREGAVLLATSTSASTTSFTFDGVFTSDYDFYFMDYYDVDQDVNNASLYWTWRNGGSDMTGSYFRSLFYGMLDSTVFSGFGIASNTEYTSNDNQLKGPEATVTGGGLQGTTWLIPQTENRKLSKNLNQHLYSDSGTARSHFNVMGWLHDTSTKADGIRVFPQSDNMSGTFRIYGLSKIKNSIKSINQSDRQSNFVQSNYIGNSAKTDGQGWIKVASTTATSGDASIEFQNIFTSKYDTYKITLEDVRPVSDGQDLEFQYIDNTTADTNTYNSSYLGQGSTGASATTTAFNQSQAQILDTIGTNGTESGFGILYTTPMSTNTDKYLWGLTISENSSANTKSQVISTYRDSTTAYSGIKFLFASGNVEAGKITIYGRQT